MLKLLAWMAVSPRESDVPGSGWCTRVQTLSEDAMLPVQDGGQGQPFRWQRWAPVLVGVPQKQTPSTFDARNLFSELTPGVGALSQGVEVKKCVIKPVTTVGTWEAGR